MIQQNQMTTTIAGEICKTQEQLLWPSDISEKYDTLKEGLQKLGEYISTWVNYHALVQNMKTFPVRL